MKRRRRRWSKEERESIYHKTNGRCAYCGREMLIDEMNCDHMVSIHNHGADSLENLLPSCRECNHFKKACNVEGFRKRLKKALLSKKRTSFLESLLLRYGENWDTIFFFERCEEDDSSVASNKPIPTNE